MDEILQMYILHLIQNCEIDDDQMFFFLLFIFAAHNAAYKKKWLL